MDIAIHTPAASINESFLIASRIINRLRDTAKRYYGVDGWLSVSDGVRNPQHSFDPRDYQHICKCVAYMWGNEQSLLKELPSRLFLDQIDRKDGHLLWCYGSDQRGVHIGQTARYLGDFFVYFGDKILIGEKWDLILKFIEWVYNQFDYAGNGLIEDGSQRDGSREPITFWGLNIGEPQNFPASDNPGNKVVVASMQWCWFMKNVAKYAIKHGLPKADWLLDQFNLTYRSLEREAYDDEEGYYFLQYDASKRKWYHSLNGMQESSREVDVTPFYVAKVCENTVRRESVAEYIYNIIEKDGVFPTPIQYPTYHFDGPAGGYRDHGDTQFICGGSWGEAYYNTVILFEKVGMCDALYHSIKRRSDVHVRDKDILEWYFKDGTIDQVHAYHRDFYGVAAASHLCAIIEGLFGLYPSGISFEELNIRPNFPLGWKDEMVSIRVNIPLRGIFGYDWLFDSSKNAIEMTITPIPAITGHFRIRIPTPDIKKVLWDDSPLGFLVYQLHTNYFVEFSHALDGRMIVLEF